MLTEHVLTVYGDRIGTTPLPKQLREDGEHETILVRRDRDQLFNGAKPCGAARSLLFTLELVVDVEQLRLDVPMVGGKIANLAQIHYCLLLLVHFQQPSRAFNRAE